MSNDPGLAADSCMFMEALPGDGGAHNASDIWWLSRDVGLNAAHDTVKLTMHRKSADSGCATSFSESLTVELWAASPSLAMVPNNPSSAKNVQNIGAQVPAEGAAATATMLFHPSLGFDHLDPHHPHAVCLVARCYPDSLTPSTQGFFAPDDQHVAQHNLCVVPTPVTGINITPQPQVVQSSHVTTVNPSASTQQVKLFAIADRKPSNFVKKTVSSQLHDTHGLLRLGSTPARSFKFVLPDFPDAQVIDHSHPSAITPLSPQTYEAKIKLAPGQLTKFTFTADLGGGQSGDVYIFHLRQIGSDNHDQGGLTLVMIAG